MCRPLNTDIAFATTEILVDMNPLFITHLLFRACSSEDIYHVNELTRRGAQFDYSSPLFATSIVKGGSSILELILINGALQNVNRTFAFIYHPNNYKAAVTKPDLTLLMLACSRGWVQCCQLLLDAGADANAQDSLEITPMH